jgi:hypothetical protein
MPVVVGVMHEDVGTLVAAPAREAESRPAVAATVRMTKPVAAATGASIITQLVPTHSASLP